MSGISRERLLLLDSIRTLIEEGSKLTAANLEILKSSAPEVSELREVYREELLTRLEEGEGKLTAAELDFLEFEPGKKSPRSSAESFEAASLASAKELMGTEGTEETAFSPAVVDPEKVSFDEFLREWICQEGVVGGKKYSLVEICELYPGRYGAKKKPSTITKAIYRKQLEILSDYGFSVDRSEKKLSGSQQQNLQLCLSIEQNRRAIEDLEIQRFVLRKVVGGSQTPLFLEQFQSLIQTQVRLAKQRDDLILKLKKELRDEKKAGGDQRKQQINIIMNSDELEEAHSGEAS